MYFLLDLVFKKKRKESTMNIKTLSLTIVTGSLLATTATADYTGLSFDVVADANIAESWTARIYANFDDPDSRLDAVFGNADNSLSIASSGGFYQNTLGGATSTAINSAFFALAPSLEWDSYVTVGALHSDGYPFGNNALLDIGIDWADFEAGGAVNTDNGTWFVTPDDAQGSSIDGRVLVGQFTMMGTDSSVYGVLNLQGKDSNGDTFQVTGQAFDFSIVPAPGALALLGLAGVASRRRRK